MKSSALRLNLKKYAKNDLLIKDVKNWKRRPKVRYNSQHSPRCLRDSGDDPSNISIYTPPSSFLRRVPPLSRRYNHCHKCRRSLLDSYITRWLNGLTSQQFIPPTLYEEDTSGEKKNKLIAEKNRRADLYIPTPVYIHTHTSHILDKFYFRGVCDASSLVTGSFYKSCLWLSHFIWTELKAR